MRLVGLRLGPFKVSFLGFLQPITDAFKLANKRVNLLSNFSINFYYLSSFFTLFSSLIFWRLLYSEPSPINFKLSFLLFIFVLSFSSLNSILAGLRTYGKYSLIGTLRSVAQLISYELSLYMCIFFFFLSFTIYDIYHINFFTINFFFFFSARCFYIWLPSFLAELNRTPYDFSEGESELVRGFNTEFGSSSFTIIFLAEYRNILFFCLLTSYFFFFDFFFLFFFLSVYFVIWIRSVLPRYRYDKLIGLAWKFFIPLLTLIFILYFLLSI